MNEDPPSPSKLALIREFLRVSGLQKMIDSGSFLDAYGGRIFAALPGDITYGQALAAPGEALRSAYEKHRHVWQDEYESHLHWEFSEDELKEMVAFFAKPVGQHYLEALWRMKAYIGTNTEHLVEEIVTEALARVSELRPSGRDP